MSGIVTVKSAVVTLALAVAAGLFVQSGTDDRPAGASLQLQAKGSFQSNPLMMVIDRNGMPVFGLPDVVTKPVDHTLTTRSTVPVRAVYVESDVPRLGTILATPVAGCPVTLTARRAAQAMVELSVSLPCATNQDVLLQHALIQFSARTDADGNVQIVVPALAAEAEFALLMDNIEYARISLPVPAVRNYDRAVLQWRGASNLQLHAFAPGATVGDAGHVWSASVHDTTETRGFVQRLGTTRADIPYLVEIYTYPSGVRSAEADLALQIGVALTPDNCGRTTDVTTFQVNRGDMVMRQILALVMPDCADAGTVVLLGDQFRPNLQAMR